MAFVQRTTLPLDYIPRLFKALCDPDRNYKFGRDVFRAKSKLYPLCSQLDDRVGKLLFMMSLKEKCLDWSFTNQYQQRDNASARWIVHYKITEGLSVEV